jgi:hypothetical protein
VGGEDHGMADGAFPMGEAAVAASTPERRRNARRRVLWRGILQTTGGPQPCLVLDLSLGGARLSLKQGPCRDQPVTLMLGALGRFRGIVVWTQDDHLGIRFCEDQLHLARRIGLSLPAEDSD